MPAKKKAKTKIRPKVQEALDSIDNTIRDLFTRVDRTLNNKQAALKGLTACMMIALKSHGIDIDPPKFKFIKKDSWTVGPADRYTAFLCVCSLNGIPITFNRKDCPEVLETSIGKFTVSPEDNHIICCPVKPVDWIDIKFRVDGDGILRGKE